MQFFFWWEQVCITVDRAHFSHLYLLENSFCNTLLALLKQLRMIALSIFSSQVPQSSYQRPQNYFTVTKRRRSADKILCSYENSSNIQRGWSKPPWKSPILQSKDFTLEYIYLCDVFVIYQECQGAVRLSMAQFEFQTGVLNFKDGLFSCFFLFYFNVCRCASRKKYLSLIIPIQEMVARTILR